MGFAAFAFNPKRFAIAFLVFEFACNAKSFAIALFFLGGGFVYFFVLFCSFSPFFQCFWTVWQTFFTYVSQIATQNACDQCRTNLIGYTEKFCVRSVSLVVICDACGPRHVMYFSLFTVISIDSIWIRTRKKKGLETRKQDRRRQKIQGSGDREIKLRSNWIHHCLCCCQPAKSHLLMDLLQNN